MRGPFRNANDTTQMDPRKYLVGALAIALLIWGPIDRSWPGWLAIRAAYLLVIPAMAWGLLDWFWKRWQPDRAAEARLSRALAGTTGGVLLVLAVLVARDDSHVECTKWQQTRDGHECVGEDVRVPGPDWLLVLGLGLSAGCAFWISARGKGPDL